MQETREQYTQRRTLETKRRRLRNHERSRGAVFEFDLVSADESIRTIKSAARKRKASATEMARITGIGKSTALRLINAKVGRGITVQRHVADAISKLEWDPDSRSLRSGNLVDRKKPRQVVRSLFAQGYTADHLAWILTNNLGVPGNCVGEVTKHARKWCRYQTHDRVMWLERNIGDAVGPAHQLRRKMLTMGVYPTKHYDASGDLIGSSLPPKIKAFYDGV